MNIYTKPVILLRHADAVNEMGEKGEVSDVGFEHALYIARQLDTIIQDRKLLIISSDATAAIQTANILRSKLNRGDIIKDARLYTDFKHHPHESWFKRKVSSFLKDDSYDVLLVVTHGQYFTACFNELNEQIKLLQHGNGYFLHKSDCRPID